MSKLKNKNQISGISCPVTSDRHEIRKQIVPMSFNEARRRKGPTYEVLIAELYEDGCLCSAHYLELLVKREAELIAEAAIRDRIIDDKKMLYDAVDMMKSAELANASFCSEGVMKTTRTLYQLLLLIESRGYKYDWLLTEVYPHIVDIVERISKKENCCRENKARIFFRYGCFLAQQKNTCVKALELFKQTLDICSGEEWLLETPDKQGNLQKLSSTVVLKTVKMLLKYADLVKATSLESAIDLSIEAVKCLSQTGIAAHKNIYYRARITRINFLMADEQFVSAMKVLIAVKKELNEETNSAFLSVACEVSKLKGECHIKLQEQDLALQELKEALTISERIEFKLLEAEIHLNLGRLYMHHAIEKSKAKTEFQTAKTLYAELNDVKGKRKCEFLLAQLQSEEVRLCFFNTLKESSGKYCHLYRLRKWKNLNKPFWENLRESELKEENDDIICLLEDGKPIVGKSTINKEKYMSSTRDHLDSSENFK